MKISRSSSILRPLVRVQLAQQVQQVQQVQWVQLRTVGAEGAEGAEGAVVAVLRAPKSSLRTAIPKWQVVSN